MAFKKALLIFFLFLLVSVPIAWFCFIVPFPKALKTAKDAPNTVNTFITGVYPEDLVIDIKKGQVSVNKSLPYCLIIDKDSKTSVVFDENPQPLTLLDPKASPYGTLCKPVALVGKNFVVYEDKNENSYRIYKLSDQMNYTVTQSSIQKLASDLLPKILLWGKILYFAAPLVAIPLVLGTFLLINFWYALVAKLAFRILKINKEISYKEVYTRTLLALLAWTGFNWIVISLLINHLARLNFTLSFPFLGTIVVVVGAILLEKYYTQNTLICN